MPHARCGRVLLLAAPTSYRVTAYRDAATTLGLDPFVVSDGHAALISALFDGLRMDASDGEQLIEALVREHQLNPFKAVLSVDDVMAEHASKVSEALSLPHNPADAARLTRRKDLGRACLARAGLPVPEFKVVDLRQSIHEQLRDQHYPAVIKPIAMSGSRGVIRVDDEAQAIAAFARVGAMLASLPDLEERNRLLVETYVPGSEFALEGLLRDNTLDVLALFDKPEPLEGPYFEETYYVTPSRLSEAMQARVADVVECACRAYGLRAGPVHAEVRIDGERIWIIEIAARTIGGDCARLLSFGSGYSLEALVLAHAADLPFSVDREWQAAGVLMIPTLEAGTLRRVEGVLEAAKVPCIEDVVITIREGYELVPLPEGSSYLGFVFAKGPDARTVEHALRRAYACLNVVVAPSWRIERAI